ncbi:hypothetical protein K438DRAFT_914088 [Mycena galopus ATCC 62051]|nr:hypothetical protein K438DRAFT_914088 [Mycena galopus ATCC 62051]
MHRNSHADVNYSSHSTPDDPEIASCGGAIFSGSQHFTVAGGNFTSVTNVQTAAPAVIPDFRTIPVGDICFLHEIGMKRGSCTAERMRNRGFVRRVFSARVVGLEGNMTVAKYEGDGAEEGWWADITRHSRLRHPNFVQLCGFTTSSAMQAAVFHDDLILFEDFVELYWRSPLLTVYIYAYCTTEFLEASNYLGSALQDHRHQSQYTLWIRRSTGGLCADLIPSNRNLLNLYTMDEMSFSRRITSVDGPNQAAMVIDALTLQEYHKICRTYLKSYRTISIPTHVTVNFGAVLSCYQGDEREALGEIAFLPDVEASASGWYGAEGEVMENGWTRQLIADTWWNSSSHRGSWLSQANHIFSRLQITSNLENFVAIEGISFKITISPTAKNSRSGYLFLCPDSEFHAGVSSLRWPDRPAFWSLNPAGVERISPEEALRLGFPTIVPTIEAWGRSWDPSVYAGLRQFHQGKGFDSDSQDVARYLGEPLFRLSSDTGPLFAHEQDNQTDIFNLLHDILPVSKTFKFTMNLQLALIVFLTVPSLYGYYGEKLK